MVHIGNPASALIGRTEREFDSLGYHFRPEGLAVAQKTLYNFAERTIRLYEQGPPAQKGRRRGEYVKRWVRWAGAGLVNIGWETWLSCILAAYLVYFHLKECRVEGDKSPCTPSV
jgi:hypothetical protein